MNIQSVTNISKYWNIWINANVLCKVLFKANTWILFTILVLVSSHISAQSKLDDQIAEFEQSFQAQVDGFDSINSAMNAEWLTWARADSLAFARFHAEVLAQWGDFRETTKKIWVEYSDNLSTRTIVDFETGTAEIEVLIPDSRDTGPNVGLLRRAVADLIRNHGKTMDYEVLDQSPLPLSQAPILQGQLKDSKGELVTTETADAYAKNIVSPETILSTPVVSSKGITRTKISVKTSLVPDHLRIRAKKYIETVRKHADHYGLDSRLILAVIHTESFFNPKARSHVPAYGLMQLVPTTGGRDAYELVTGNSANPLPNDLYNPDFNIELGCAYFSILRDRYLSGIDNPQSRILCSICAYNTGAGNVSRAFSNSRRVDIAVAKVNTLSADQVLSTLKNKLPYKETRHYIKNILDRINYYDEWKN